MTQQEANYQSISVCASFLIAFIGAAHEVVGPTLFPWAPDWFGFVLWHAIGFAAIIAGLLFLAAAFNKIDFPVVPSAIAVGIGGLAAMMLMVVKTQVCHYFAMWLSIASFTLAGVQRKVAKLRQG